MYYRLRFTNYFDVWGNKKDGWEVNNQCIEWDDVWTKDLDNRTLLKILKDTGFLQKHVRINQIDFEWLGPECCEISARRNHYPLGRIEIIDQMEDD